MASATSPRLSFSFHPRTRHPQAPQPKSTRTHLPFPKPLPARLAISSVDVSKEDKPTLQEDEPEPRRPDEKFVVLNTGVYECRSCGYTYDMAVGDPSYPVPPGLLFEKLPDDWRCPTCGAAKSFFVSKSVEIAGFAENQRFGLGGNTLTSGQKAALIYGSLLLFFALFLSGYFLQ